MLAAMGPSCFSCASTVEGTGGVKRPASPPAGRTGRNNLLAQSSHFQFSLEERDLLQGIHTHCSSSYGSFPWWGASKGEGKCPSVRRVEPGGQSCGRSWHSTPGRCSSVSPLVTTLSKARSAAENNLYIMTPTAITIIVTHTLDISG